MRSGHFTEVIDRGAGSVRARGHLTVQAADLLSGAALSLHAGGHARVVLDLQDVRGADDAGLRALRSLATELTADGCALVVLHPPADEGC